MITLHDLLRNSNTAEAVPATAAPLPFADVVIDSRLARPGALFIALAGEHVDGHQFVADAFRRGARAALVRESWVPKAPAGLDMPVVRTPSDLASIALDRSVLVAVPDPLSHIQATAAAYRLRFDLHVVGITGSVGKTTTKELVAAIFRQRWPTLASAKSWNNEIGVPLTLLQLDPSHRAAVLEMGTYGPGEIALLCTWARPSHGIVTNVGVSHLDRMKTPEIIAQAKGELVAALPHSGAAILNHDDPRVRAMAERTTARTIFYGLTPEADVWADAVEVHGLQGISFTVHAGPAVHRVTAPLVGRHNISNALAAISLALDLGWTWTEIEAGLCDPLIKQRLVVVPGPGGTLILDDTYNAAPASVTAALRVLDEVPGRHLAVLGEMAELGPADEAGHREVGAAAAAVVETLLTIGPKGRWIAAAARATNPRLDVFAVQNNAEAVQLLRELLRPGDVVLVKGARVAATEEIVRALVVGE